MFRHQGGRQYVLKDVLLLNKLNSIPTWSASMTMSSNGNIFRVTSPLWGESTGYQWIPLTKAKDAEFLCFLWSYLNKQGKNNSDAGDLRCHHIHYDVTVMPLLNFEDLVSLYCSYFSHSIIFLILLSFFSMISPAFCMTVDVIPMHQSYLNNRPVFYHTFQERIRDITLAAITGTNKLGPCH